MKHRSYNIHERFIRHIWSKQYLKHRLVTTDRRALVILDVGQLNPDGGPDFCNAKIKIEGITYIGDVEIHRTMFDWIRHQHQEDPRYNKVILHVVLESGNNSAPTFVKSGRPIPVLILGQFLPESIHTVWHKAILDERAKKSETIRCYKYIDTVSSDTLESWLTKLAVERLELKLRRFEERLKQLAHEYRMTVREKQRPYGELPLEGEHDEIPPPHPELSQKDLSKKELWEQILYEGIMEALGYSKNREPFIRLARSVTLNLIRDFNPGTEEETQALLFGAAGLIPKISSLKEKEARLYVQQLARKWKALRPSFRSEILHKADWQFFPTRPSNFPTLRIAAASVLTRTFLNGDFFRNIIQTLKSGLSQRDTEERLISFFNIEANHFWKNHFTFDQPCKKIISSLGLTRIHEILINSVLPIALLYARVFKDKAVRKGALELYQSLPASENNAILRMMNRQLLKGRLPLDVVSRQQAVIQLFKYYCSDGRCSECEIGQKAFI